MKAFRIFLFTLLTLALLAGTQVFASPLPGPDAQGTKPAKTPGAQATQNAVERAAGQTGKGKHENFKGTVEAVDAGSITLKLRDGSTVTVALGATAQIKFPGRKDLAPAAIQVGVQAMVQALRDGTGNLVALRVMVIPGKPSKIHRVGTVTAYTAGSSITIQTKQGETFTFEISSDTVLLHAEGADNLDVGSLVTIIAPRDPATGGVRMTGIVVHPAGP